MGCLGAYSIDCICGYVGAVWGILVHTLLAAYVGMWVYVGAVWGISVQLAYVGICGCCMGYFGTACVCGYVGVVWDISVQLAYVGMWVLYGVFRYVGMWVLYAWVAHAGVS